MRTTALTVSYILIGGLLLSGEGCTLEMECAKTVVEDLPAPDGQHHAVIFNRNCGATTSVRTQVSVLARGEAAEGGANLFGTDEEFGPELPPSKGQPLHVRWLDARTLEIHYDTRGRAFVHASQHGPIRVRYVGNSRGKSTT